MTAPPQLLEPVDHEVDFRGLERLDWLKDQEAAVGRHVVVRAEGISAREIPVEELLWVSNVKGGLEPDGDRHHRVALSVEELPSALGPRRLGASANRHLFLLGAR